MAWFLKDTDSGRLILADGPDDPELSQVHLSSAEYRELLNRINEAEQTAGELQDALDQQKDLNWNLKRIAIERSNAKRDLKPKKERSGYLVLYSVQYREHYQDDDGKRCVANTWKSVLQTPYDASLPLKTIRDEIRNDLAYSVLFKMDIRLAQPKEENGKYEKFLDEETGEEVCGLYRWGEYRANFRAGFWEITLYHTLELNVPEEFRPAHKS